VIVTYTPADAPVEAYSTDDLSAIESAAIESVTGSEWSEVEDSLKGQKPTAMRAVLWAFRKRQEPTLRFSEFDVPGWKRRLKARLAREEVLDLVEALVVSKDATPEYVEGMLAHMRTLAHDAQDVEWAVAETAPKALADLPAGAVKSRASKPKS
jgi:hypothetical protein